MVLRHKAADFGLNVRPDGFVRVDDLMRLSRFTDYSVQQLHSVVENNDKQRFSLWTDDEGTEWIRANQGHSAGVNVSADELYERIESAEDIPVCVHGTSEGAWEAIRRQGLKKMGRQHIHFAPGLPGESGVISGMRYSCSVFIYLDVAKAMERGVVLYRSANNVILTEGLDGTIPPNLFASVSHADGRTLWPGNGQQPQADVPQAADEAAAREMRARREREGGVMAATAK